MKEMGISISLYSDPKYSYNVYKNKDNIKYNTITRKKVIH